MLLATEHFADLARLLRDDPAADERIVVLPADTQGMNAEALAQLADRLTDAIVAALCGRSAPEHAK